MDRGGGMLSAGLTTFIFAVLNSLGYGLLLFLLSSGLTVVFGLLGVLNVAHASFYMLGAYLAYELVQRTGSFWLALIVAPLVLTVLGIICERYMLRRVHALGHWHQLLLTMGLGYVLLEGVKWIWGTESHPMVVPEILTGSINIGGGAYPIYRIFMSVSALVTLGVLAAVLFKTKLGMVVRAAVSNKDMVNALGYNVGYVFTGVFALGAFLAGVAGVIAAPMLSVYPGMAADIGVDIFIVVVVGGLGSLKGALIASLLLGIFQSFGILIVPDFAIFFSFLLMAVVLTLKPMGLYGERAA